MPVFPAAALAHFDKTDLPADAQAKESKLTDVLQNADEAFDRVYGQTTDEGGVVVQRPQSHRQISTK